ncbi:MAG: GIY-YIG nuclease family protein [Candidatus Cloacimonadota bacterium]|nr:GIY-YIG nuclease family protein [Candidatus Cloacimonadota bacterium]
MYYTYIIESKTVPTKKYIGYTSDLKKRLNAHNSGNCKFTSKYKPWKINTYIAFIDREKAMKFEKYLKSGSGHAFTKKHF